MNTPDSAFTVVRTTRTAIEAEVLIAALRSEGLHPRELDTASHISYAGTDISYHIEVPTTELAAARELLDALQNPAQPS